MTANNINNIREEISKLRPLIHSITNPISINECANAILALGGRPIMAEHPDEAGEITSSANSLMINLGNITDSRMKAIPISLAVAKELKLPVIIDMVGIACSALRRDFAINLLNSFRFSVIKGNYSELFSLYNSEYRSSGVDTDPAIDESTMTEILPRLAKRYNCTILASGKTDIITDGDTLAMVKNGTSALSGVTGTGCMLGAICALCLSVSDSFMSAVFSAAILGIAGELADIGVGSASFMTSLLDRLSLLKDKDIEKSLKLELIKNEEN